MASSQSRVVVRYLVARRKLALTYSKALEVLGFKPNERPSEDEINRKYRTLIKDLLKKNPDSAGDQEIMRPLNEAKDILRGLLSPDREPGGPVDFGGGGVDVGPVEPPPPEKKIKFSEAASKAGIPGDVEWFFVTTTAYSGYSSSEFTNQATGWVACGQTKSDWVFVSVEHHRQRAYVVGVRDQPLDVWDIHTVKQTKNAPVPTAAELYGGVMKAWKKFEVLDKKFNSKVVSAKGWSFGEKRPEGRAVSIKMLIANELGGEFTGKMKVEVAYKEDRDASYDGPPSSGYFKAKWGRPYQITLIINGRDHTLSVPDMEALSKVRVGGKDFVDRVFGQYPEHSRPKDLTRNRDGKKIMAWMAEKLPHLPDWVREGLTKAATK